MKIIEIKAAKNQTLVANACRVADDFWMRFAGYMMQTVVPEGEGILFPDSKSVHMWFMKVPLDIVFLKNGRISSLHPNVRPWTPLPLTDLRADSVLEVPVGTIQRCDLKTGDELCIN